VVVATSVPRPAWLMIISLLAVAGIVAWPVLALLGLLGAIEPIVVVDVGIVTAGLAYVAVRRIKRDRAIAMEAAGLVDPPEPPPDQPV
jgi:hypothetical protein